MISESDKFEALERDDEDDVEGADRSRHVDLPKEPDDDSKN